ncbi:MAG: glycosyltransferase family 4 protein [Thermoleophilia bacterium]
MRRLVFVTQQVDPEHPALAATIPKIAALAQRLDEVVVLADSAVPGTLPDNCRVRTFGAGSKAGRGLRFERALAAELRERPLGVVAHMAPVFAVLAASLARPLRVPVVLWYTHWHASPTLRLAARLVNAIVSVDRRSFPLDSPKVHAIGHGIDLSEFECMTREPHEGVNALALGRYSEAKGLDVVLRALRLALDRGLDVRLEVHGPTLNDAERAQRAELDRLAAELELGDSALLGDAVPRRELPALFARCDVLINNMRAGAPDKVVYEAAASCLPVVASNPVFDTLLSPDALFDRDDSASLVDALGRIEPDARPLREQVERDHSVEHWAERLIDVVERA